MIFSIRQEPETWRRSSCGATRIIHRGRVTRRFRSLPIGCRATFVDLPIPRVECLACAAVRQVVVKLFNEKPSDLRRALHRKATDVREKEVLKGTRWLLLKNAGNLDEEKGEKRRLEEALALNKPLETAYSMKEELRQETRHELVG